MEAKITGVRAREVLDSRGNPTIEAQAFSGDNSASAIVPSGASTGSFEALELRDGGKRFNGKGVLKAVSNVNSIIAPRIFGRNPTEQKEIDSFLIELDGTANKSRLGANSLLAVSMSVCALGAKESGKELFEHISKLFGSRSIKLPIPQVNVINGGKHAGMEHEVQEHLLMPVKAKDFPTAMQAAVETYHALKKMLKEKFGAQGVLLGDEGGFAPKINSLEERLELMLKAVEEAGYSKEMALALDVAASELFENGNYFIGEKKFSAGELADFYFEVVSRYPVVSIEDGLAENDWKGWSELNKKLGKKVQVVGDDILVTNSERIGKAVELNACNALLLKVNQIGTVSESMGAAKMALDAGWRVVVSHRSGETEDSFIADLVVGLGTGQSKFGAPARSERNAKYNRLLRINEKPGEKAAYAEF